MQLNHRFSSYLGRHLETSSVELTKRAQQLEETNLVLEAELKATKIQLHAIKDEKERVQSEKKDMTINHLKTLEVYYKDRGT